MQCVRSKAFFRAPVLQKGISRDCQLFEVLLERKCRLNNCVLGCEKEEPVSAANAEVSLTDTKKHLYNAIIVLKGNEP